MDLSTLPFALTKSYFYPNPQSMPDMVNVLLLRMALSNSQTLILLQFLPLRKSRVALGTFKINWINVNTLYIDVHFLSCGTRQMLSMFHNRVGELNFCPEQHFLFFYLIMVLIYFPYLCFKNWWQKLFIPYLTRLFFTKTIHDLYHNVVHQLRYTMWHIQ